ncbi:MAG: peptidoglycan-binding protein [Verrucomicrobia bacterium]|nr:peptidoglycan-binding protein [Verrucomicrobiota bacterium]
MKNLVHFRWLGTAIAAGSLLYTQPLAQAHGIGGISPIGSHSRMNTFSRDGRSAFAGRRFAPAHLINRALVSRDRFFFRHHHSHFIFVFDFAAFGFPWWYPDYFYWSPSYYPYDVYGPAFDPQYWIGLAVSVQSALAERGYYRNDIDGEIGSNSRDAIREFQKAQGLPVTGMIDPKLLKALRVKYKSA